jgi:hypothetical protein
MDLCSLFERRATFLNPPDINVVTLLKSAHTFKKQKIYHTAQFERK